MPGITFNTSGIESLLKILKPGKAANSDDIPTVQLTAIAASITVLSRVCGECEPVKLKHEYS